MDTETHCRRPAGILLLVGIMFALVACGGRPAIESDLGIEHAPDWVNEGTAMLIEDDERVFYGVDSASPMSSLSLQRSTADDRARAELARILSSYMEVVADDYRATAGSGDAELSEAQVTRQIRAVSEVNLAGSTIVARWRDEETGDIHSLARIRLDNVTRTLDSVEEMNAGLRDHARGRATRLFDRMIGEEGS